MKMFYLYAIELIVIIVALALIDYRFTGVLDMVFNFLGGILLVAVGYLDRMFDEYKDMLKK